ncbi:unnamed protein product, partial [Polarella glacialis]
ELVRDVADSLAVASAAEEPGLRGGSEEDAEEDEHCEELQQMMLQRGRWALQGSAYSSEQRGPKESQLGRRAMYSHHIINSGKRQAIKEWAAQLRLGGLAKIGWPGVIIVEGHEADVRRYVEALSHLKWKQFVVRGEQIDDVDCDNSVESLRQLPVGVEEFADDDMSGFAARCRECGLDELFRMALKIPASRGSGSSKLQQKRK